MASEENQFEYQKKIEQAYLYAKANNLNFKYNMPMLYQFIRESTELAMMIGGVFGLDESDEYRIACLFSNVGMSATSGMEFQGRLDPKQHEYFKKHTTRGADILTEIGLDNVAEIVRCHHEKPNAKGYHRLITYPFESNLIRMADEFCMMTRPSQRRMNNAYDAREAARNVLVEFRGYETIISHEHQELLFKIMVKHYER